MVARQRSGRRFLGEGCEGCGECGCVQARCKPQGCVGAPALLPVFPRFPHAGIIRRHSLPFSPRLVSPLVLLSYANPKQQPIRESGRGACRDASAAPPIRCACAHVSCPLLSTAILRQEAAEKVEGCRGGEATRRSELARVASPAVPTPPLSRVHLRGAEDSATDWASCSWPCQLCASQRAGGVPEAKHVYVSPSPNAALSSP